MGQTKPYPFTKALQVVGARQFESMGEYLKACSADPRLVPNPQEEYKDCGWQGWGHYLQKEPKSRKKQDEERSPRKAKVRRLPDYYSDAQTASEVARALGIANSNQYPFKRRQDPKLPPDPERHYEFLGWVSWPVFLGFKTSGGKYKF